MVLRGGRCCTPSTPGPKRTASEGRPYKCRFSIAGINAVNQMNTFLRAALRAALCSLLSSKTVIAAPLPPSSTEARPKIGERIEHESLERPFKHPHRCTPYPFLFALPASLPRVGFHRLRAEEKEESRQHAESRHRRHPSRRAAHRQRYRRNARRLAPRRHRNASLPLLRR